jgi:sulfate adenylyltransferase subunit 2
MDLIVHVNESGLAAGVSPIASGSALHTKVMKTEALRQATQSYATQQHRQRVPSQVRGGVG